MEPAFAERLNGQPDRGLAEAALRDVSSPTSHDTRGPSPRRAPHAPSFRSHAGWLDDDAPALNAQDGTHLLDAPEDYEGLDFVRTRRPEPEYDPDPDPWLKASEMTQTEVSLRLARHLLAQKLAGSDVSVALTGYELTRRVPARRGHGVALALLFTICRGSTER
jgi:hypothetical protein